MPPVPTSFTCPDCGSFSLNPNDIQNRYCGRCHSFTARPNMAEWIQSNGLLYVRSLGDGRATWISRKLYTWAICIGQIKEPCFDDTWCYETLDDAFRALTAWNPLTEKEPENWIRHPPSGRRHGGEVRV